MIAIEEDVIGRIEEAFLVEVCGICDDGKMLLLVYEEFYVAVATGIGEQVDAATECFGSTQNTFAVGVEFYGIDNGILLAGIVSEIDVLIAEWLEGDLDLVAWLSECEYRGQQEREG